LLVGAVLAAALLVALASLMGAAGMASTLRPAWYGISIYFIIAAWLAHRLPTFLSPSDLTSEPPPRVHSG
ncbi:MAG TPA: hypothetical protein VN812_06370, partial [Candidatus Acidoferrales bacterium]|nr:hypothetical protein [Candidatus Acidoferrales bacterium]